MSVSNLFSYQDDMKLVADANTESEPIVQKIPGGRSMGLVNLNQNTWSVKQRVEGVHQLRNDFVQTLKIFFIILFENSHWRVL